MYIVLFLGPVQTSTGSAAIVSLSKSENYQRCLFLNRFDEVYECRYNEAGLPFKKIPFHKDYPWRSIFANYLQFDNGAKFDHGAKFDKQRQGVAEGGGDDEEEMADVDEEEEEAAGEARDVTMAKTETETTTRTATDTETEIGMGALATDD